MADVFVSYKRDERSAVEQIASSLRALGLTVWFDASMSAGETFNAEIDREARAAKVVLVCWSPAARQSEWVNAEAMIGFEQKKLATCYVVGPDGFSAQTPFNTSHAEDLRAWLTAPSETHMGWKSLLRRIGKLCDRVDIESWGALDAQAKAPELRAWIAAHEASPLCIMVDGLLRECEAEGTEGPRLEQEAWDCRAVKEAERSAWAKLHRKREGEQRGLLQDQRRQFLVSKHAHDVRTVRLRAAALLVLLATAVFLVTVAVSPLRLAAILGDAGAMTTLGYKYYTGEGVQQNNGEAIRLFRLAASQGSGVAQANLARMYHNGEGVARDDGEALRLYRLAAIQGDAGGQVGLGQMYEFGHGVPQDYAEAAGFYWLAASQGDAVGQFNLAILYLRGEGVTQSDADAVRYFRLAANQEYAAAQHRLATMLESGRGVAQNDIEAVRLYRLAARQGNASAQQALSRKGLPW